MSTNDAQQKYNCRTAHLYRDKLANAAAAAHRSYGTRVHIDAAYEPFSEPTVTSVVDEDDDYGDVSDQAENQKDNGQDNQDVDLLAVTGDEIHKSSSSNSLKSATLSQPPPNLSQEDGPHLSASGSKADLQAASQDDDREISSDPVSTDAEKEQKSSSSSTAYKPMTKIGARKSATKPKGVSFSCHCTLLGQAQSNCKCYSYAL